MKVIYNKENWNLFRLNTRRSPKSYPVMAWMGLSCEGSMNEHYVSLFHEMPVDPDNDLAIAAYALGFSAGKGVKLANEADYRNRLR